MVTKLAGTHKGHTLKKTRLLVVSAALVSLTGAALAPTSFASASPTKLTPPSSSPAGRSSAKGAMSQATLARLRGATAVAPSAGAPVKQQTGTGAMVAHLDPELNAIAGLPGAGTNVSVPVERDGTVRVTLTGSGAKAAAQSVGAKVLSSFGGQVGVSVPPSKLTSLAGYRGVTEVSRSIRTVELGATSEGVHASGADLWQSAAPQLGNGGAGVNVGIVDGGFGHLQTEIQAGNLSASQIVYSSGMNHCPGTSDQDSDHGTAVSEIVHQMAPQATLYLYCVYDNVTFNEAAAQIVTAGNIKVVNSSLGVYLDSRGDGYGGNQVANSTEDAVKKAREAGVLWIQSAGNSADHHWSGKLTRIGAPAKDPTTGQTYQSAGLYTDQYGTYTADETILEPGASGDVLFTWDQWPSSTYPVTLRVEDWGKNDTGDGSGRPLQVWTTTQHSGSPTLGVPITNTSVVSGDYHRYHVLIELPTNMPAVHYDLFYDGETSSNALSYTAPAAAAAGSMLQPSTSPWVLAVGAAWWKDGSIEPFSSRGPTIDGRQKPDLIGYDGTSSDISDVESDQYDQNTGDPIAGTHGFYGTSAAAPHVAGAAALIAAANPNMDAGEIEAFLESPNNGANAVSPPNSTSGHGELQLGQADANQVQPAPGSRYHQLSSPTRIADTRSGLGVRKGKLGAGTQVNVPVSNSLVPADATSVVVSVSGTAAQGGTFLSVYPNSFGGNATLPLTTLEANETTTTIVRLNSAHGFHLRNQAAATDALVTVLGYFGAPTETGGLGYVPLTDKLLLDTRVPTGGPKGPMKVNQSITVDATTGGVPTDASIAVITLTALNHKAGGYLTVYPSANPAVASVNYASLARPNLVLVPVVNGKLTLTNRFATTDAIVHIVGYFSSSATGRFVTLASPIRITDTRSGNGGLYGPLTKSIKLAQDAGGLYGVPYDVTGMWIGMTAIGLVNNPATGNGYLTIYPNRAPQPHASNLDFTGNRSILNNGIATLSAPAQGQPPGFTTADTGASVNVIEDEYGYFINPPVSN
jgi:hypothetical protein